MNEQENTKLAAKTYELFTSGDIEALLNLYSDDISWELPFVEGTPFGGKLKGRDEVANFFGVLAENEENLTFEPTEFIARGDKVVVLGNFTWRVKSTNRQYASDFAHVVTVKDGKISRFVEYMDTVARNNAYVAAQSA
ncbi:nuclear transport factor 2 family protein [soil metagenome]